MVGTASQSSFKTVDETIDYINNYISYGDKKRVCQRLKYDTSNMSKMLKKKIGPNFDVLRELKKIADQNYSKLNGC